MFEQPLNRKSLNHLNEALDCLSQQLSILETALENSDMNELVELESRVDEISMILDRAYRQARIKEIGLKIVA